MEGDLPEDGDDSDEVEEPRLKPVYPFNIDVLSDPTIPFGRGRRMPLRRGKIPYKYSLHKLPYSKFGDGLYDEALGPNPPFVGRPIPGEWSEGVLSDNQFEILFSAMEQRQVRRRKRRKKKKD